MLHRLRRFRCHARRFTRTDCHARIVHGHPTVVSEQFLHNFADLIALGVEAALDRRKEMRSLALPLKGCRFMAEIVAIQ